MGGYECVTKIVPTNPQAARMNNRGRVAIMEEKKWQLCPQMTGDTARPVAALSDLLISKAAYFSFTLALTWVLGGITETVVNSM